jgi:putative SOS response-associated peptidase YedK
MCGRFTLTIDSNAVARAFNVAVPKSLQTGPRYNVAPTQDVVTVLNDGEPHLDLLRWGLIPSWAKDASIGSRMINARAETLAEKPSFKRLLNSRRCLIPADGFYEWQKVDGGKVPMYITLKGHEPFAFAGLWDSWETADGEVLRTCTIITTHANDMVAPIHERMPVILPSDAREMWLDPGLHDANILLPLLKPYDPEAMQAREVSRRVNSPQYDGSDLIA